MKSTKNRPDQKAETRQFLLEAALRVFARRGILAATASEVAREAGRAHGSVFVHFGTQEGLVCAAVESFGLGLAGRLHRLVEEGAGPRAVLEAHLKGIGEVEAFYTRLVAEAPLLPPAARLSLVAVQSAVAFHLTPAFEAEMAAGRLKPLAPAFLFNAWTALVHHYLVNAEFFAPGASVTAVCGSGLVDQFLSMLSDFQGGKP